MPADRIVMSFLRTGLAPALVLLLASANLPAAAWEQEGIASWYGGIFQGRKTANGEIYDTYLFTCAHKTLPFGTMLEVTNLANGKVVEVRVNDRGPFVDDRIIDLSYAAAHELDMIRDGTAQVRIRVEEGTMPRFDIQIGAWGSLENATLHRKKLSEAGIPVTAVLGSDGITRISIRDIAEADVFARSMELEALGYTKLFIRQR